MPEKYIMKFLLNYLMQNQNQIIKFIVIGFTTFCINFLSFHFFYGICILNYKIATTFAYSITVVSHFTLHRIITFEVKRNEQHLGLHVGKYLFMLIINYIITITVMWATVEIIHGSAYIGLIASTMATASSSFFIMKYFVFANSIIKESY
ncbi:MAG: hypothetical protein ACD_46C00181G0004 [uncultured bacterium]|nr:MAG: hypothetical protein ACD_46C00181G0004 [uncultured bacterium]